MDITIFRYPPIKTLPSTLPAGIYNQAHALVSRSLHGAVFVPIRSMQVLAILDREEFVFVDSQHRSLCEIAWQRFRPQARQALDAPVPYEVIFYALDGTLDQGRLLSEFPKALQLLASKEHLEGPAKVLKFTKKPHE